VSPSELRQRLVDDLRGRGYVRSDRVAGAFAAVPRERFLADHAERHGLDAVYQDEAIVTRRDPTTGEPTSSSSQPAIMAEMLELLAPAPGERVAEIGAGTGYNAALLAHLVGDEGVVTSIELDPEVAADARRNLREAGCPATVVVGDGRDGVPGAAPIDAMMATASVDAVPKAWHDQLRTGGRLVLPLRISRVGPIVFGLQVVVGLRRGRRGFEHAAAVAGAFMALRDPRTPPARPARIAAAEQTDAGGGRPIVGITGPALAGLDGAGRRALVVRALGFARSEAVDLRGATPWAPLGYAALALPEERLVEVSRPGWRALGVVDAADSSLALLRIGLEGVTLEAYGGRGAEGALRAALDRWARAGRPGLDDLVVNVRYGPERPHAWRCLRRSDQWIALDWR
jgi:protein-L-isoaspartate(D-aspartate) O-methyltransferase